MNNILMLITAATIATAMTGCRPLAKVVASEGGKVIMKAGAEGLAAGAAHAGTSYVLEHRSEPQKKEEQPLGRNLADARASLMPIGGAVRPVNAFDQTPATHLAAPDLDESTKSRLRMAIETADEAESLASQTLQTECLENGFTGEALRQEISRVEKYRTLDYRRESARVRSLYDWFKVSPDGQNAQVKVTETWRTRHFDRSGTQIYDSGDHDTAQIAHLELTNAGWKVSSFDFQ